MANEIKKLKVQRANAKRSLTTYESFLQNFDPSVDFPVLEKRYKEIETIRESFESVMSELELLVEDTEECENYRTEFEEKYYKAYRIATNLLSSRGPQASGSQNTEIINNTTNQSVGQLEANFNSRPTLPKINLPTFDGSYEAWLGFYDLFTSLVHTEARIPTIHKLFYLKGCLTGEAAEVIDSLQSSAENYEEAWNLLKERYDNKKVIREAHITSILNLPSLSDKYPVRSLLNDIQKHIRALKVMKEPVDTWDSILIVIIRNKFNEFIREKWDKSSNDTPTPTMAQMISFLTSRTQLENQNQSSSSKSTVIERKNNSRTPRRSHQAFVASTVTPPCIVCNGNHFIKSCKKFESMSPLLRYEHAKKSGWCINCLRSGHRASQCSSGNCKICNQKHNTLLHFDKKDESNNIANIESPSSPQSQSKASVNLHAQLSSEVLLATAIVDIINKKGKTKSCRILLDAGSQAHFITEEVAKFLNLDRNSVNISVTGVDSTSTNITESTVATIKSKCTNYMKNVEFLIVPRVTSFMPSIVINHDQLDIPKNITLADPEFFKPLNIDALIGVQLFYKLLCIGQITLKNHPNAILQKTQLGWIIAGEINTSPNVNRLHCHLTVRSNEDINLTRFWEMEEIPTTQSLSLEEEACENHYKFNTQRTADGRYIVKLPFKDNLNKLGQSYSMALKRFHSLEYRLNKDNQLKNDYSKFMHEYQQLNHMSLCQTPLNDHSYHLPHHAVIKNDSITTKVRVVFDGSAKTSSGLSLNDTLMVGPKIQEDLFNILIRFRSHPYVLTADIEKMYRQIRVHKDDTRYQKILYRENSLEPIKQFTLDTVTYGTSCAPFLAIRTLHQLADDEAANHPLASMHLKRDFYVDDLLTGAKTRQEAEFLRDEMQNLLNKGGFCLRKWASNEPSLVAKFNENPEKTHMSLNLDSTIKTSGINWNSQKDKIFYKVHLSPLKTITKRTILSQIAKLFDPLGLLGPIIVHAKIIIQLLWKSGVSWDESIPQDIHTLWTSYQNQLPRIEKLQFDRYTLKSDVVDIQLHGFCDASEKAYGACVYLRLTNTKGEINVSLLCSKTRIAPISSVTLPHLELCSALLLARLYTTIIRALALQINEIYLWSDSMIALHWMKTSPHLLKTFVANRVAEIQRLTPSCKWHHVASHDNPADLASRGLNPSEFLQENIWQHGPQWLQQDNLFWPKEKFALDEALPELKPPKSTQYCLKIILNEEDFTKRYSSINKVIRVVAYIQRFIHNTKHKNDRVFNELTAKELALSLRTIIRVVQYSSFCKEINQLKHNEPLHDRSKLIPLNPYLDEDGLLRVGGRLAHAALPDNQRHPLVLPSQHHITHIIIREEHLRLKHAGAQATLYSIRQNYWPLNGRNITRKIIHNCVPCFRVKPRIADHLIGNLPKSRVTYSRPFLEVGIDYCGPLYIKEKRHRNRNRIKVYVAIYVCMSTKAVHLELVSDLTTDAFIASLKRFFSRRGKSTAIYSDNATNFVGANRELKELQLLINSESHINSVKSYLTNEIIAWHFIPPKSPHFGGIWEAAVKSFKHHLLRTVGNTLLTFEQLETCIVEIEAILNSRPISPMSSDHNDILPLTPGHFLIGGPLTSIPDIDYTATPSNRLPAWQHAQQIKRHFWNRWQKEYLHQLITLSTRTPAHANLQVGQLVIIKEDNLPPLQWALGRIIATHPGEDDVTRVVTLKTKNGEYKRCVRKLCPLPIESNYLEL